MKLGKELRRNLDSNLWTRLLILCATLSLPLPAAADPIINDIQLPPVSFSRIDDNVLLEQIGLGGTLAAWCYDDGANAVLITAPARERAKCELKLMYEIEKLKVKHKFEIDKLKLRVDTLITQHNEINTIKDREIEKLTQAALDRPNDYSVWWATGGVITGVATTLLIVTLVK